ncbi:unnamed protein product [Protopolystoma xenopodis]|uniref:Uncharacterized protein n=1 Tax=Protopolystoma xenopodis TaxID=117903 RepID=A0A3S5AYE4_9PLAT|nr:unnamed protein product [Protopolystoma xenopodis]
MDARDSKDRDIRLRLLLEFIKVFFYLSVPVIAVLLISLPSFSQWVRDYERLAWYNDTGV